MSSNQELICLGFLFLVGVISTLVSYKLIKARLRLEKKHGFIIEKGCMNKIKELILSASTPVDLKEDFEKFLSSRRIFIISLPITVVSFVTALWFLMQVVTADLLYSLFLCFLFQQHSYVVTFAERALTPQKYGQPPEPSAIRLENLDYEDPSFCAP